jgi:hypothetical protein
MRTQKQISWINGKGLPPKIKVYSNVKDYLSDIERYLPLNITQAYTESLEKRGN